MFIESPIIILIYSYECHTHTPKMFCWNVGLGERKIALPSAANPEEVLDVLYQNFPKLKDGGGFEYLKAEGASKMFREIPLPPNGGFTAANLKTIAKNSRIYLRPVQRDLDMTVVSVTYKKPDFNISYSSVEDDTDLEDDITLIDPFDMSDDRGSSSSISTEAQPTTSQGASLSAVGNVSSSVTQPQQPQNETDGNSVYDRYISEYDNVVDPDDGNDSNDDILNAVIEESLLEAQVEGDDQNALDAKLQGDLIKMREKTVSNLENAIVIRRKKVIKTALNAIQNPGFSFANVPKVCFSGEEAEDLGGPRREFFRLLMQNLTDIGTFEGRMPKVYLNYSLTLLDKGVYRIAGQFISWSVLHGGQAFPYLHPGVYSMMCNVRSNDFAIADITDEEVYNNLNQIHQSTTQEDLNVVMDKIGQWAAGRGCPEIFSVTLSTKNDFILKLLKQHMFYGCKAAIDQFIDGMNSVGDLWATASQNPNSFQQLFVAGKSKPLTHHTVRKLFTIRWADENVLLKEKEEDTIYCWEQFLKKCEEGECKLKTFSDDGGATGLHHVLRFVSGADSIPPTGFDKQVDIHFFTPVSGLKNYPTASTCGLEIHLPRGVSDEASFCQIMMEAILDSPGMYKV
ncbi:G2/M phase-specific E3 ubiquitin-protein ligase [Holothuria leucospilota]|uniref:HECT-type E3 ubiquitin transferase n=1 Tax=Holothuria leucospilota TaxID=206669 RepID=A0A9Q1HGY8_HOLLE|nr:G2/M phase-specific E3 ubiquitin-protein ligase [Holothuria leucospilota]